MAPPPSTAISPVTALTLRVIIFVALLISVIVSSTNGVLSASQFSPYTYLFVCGVVGIVYTTLQIGFTISRVGTGNQFAASNIRILFDFYGDKAISYMLATGAAAVFGRTLDLGYQSHYRDMYNASASILLIGFLFSAVLTVFSSLPLLKRS